MDPVTATVDCPDCSHPVLLRDFVTWGAQVILKTASCGDCGSTITFPTAHDGSIDTTHAAVGRAVHGTTREARELETLASRPSVGRRE